MGCRQGKSHPNSHIRCSHPHSMAGCWRFPDVLHCHDGKADCQDVVYIFSVRIFASHDTCKYLMLIRQFLLISICKFMLLESDGKHNV